MTPPSHNSLSRASSSYLRSRCISPSSGMSLASGFCRRSAATSLCSWIWPVWCHWCHVMDRESYDDPEVAAIVNEHYIAVKVDRTSARYRQPYQIAVSSLNWARRMAADGVPYSRWQPFYAGLLPPQRLWRPVSARFASIARLIARRMVTS